MQLLFCHASSDKLLGLFELFFRGILYCYRFLQSILESVVFIEKSSDEKKTTIRRTVRKSEAETHETLSLVMTTRLSPVTKY